MSLVTRLKKKGHTNFVECIWSDDEFSESVDYLKRHAIQDQITWIELWYRDDTDEDSVMIFRGVGPWKKISGMLTWRREERE